MSIQEFENKCFKELNFLYSDQEINSLCKYAYQEYFGTNWPSEILDKSQEIINEKQELFENYLNQLILGNPYQYIFGYAEFYGLRLKVGEGVLIPRPETEQLVDWVLEDFATQDNLKVLDACCGSGAISLALSKHLESARLTGIDNSEQALEYAIENDKIHQSNLCSEIFLMNDENHSFTCVLSSMNIAKYEEWKDTYAVQIATIFLDAVIEDMLIKAKSEPGFERVIAFTEKSRAIGLTTSPCTA